MTLYTSYYAKLKMLPGNMCPVAISRIVPGFYTGAVYVDLAPPFDLLHDYKQHGIGEDEYTQRFNLKLEQLDPVRVITDLQRLVPVGSIPVLVCYEKSDRFCHRHLVARWLTCDGFICTEYDTEKA